MLSSSFNTKPYYNEAMERMRLPFEVDGVLDNVYSDVEASMTMHAGSISLPVSNYGMDGISMSCNIEGLVGLV